MGDAGFVYIMQLTRCMNLIAMYREYLLHNSFGDQIQQHLKDPVNGQTINLSVNTQYKIVIDLLTSQSYDQTNIKCNLCCKKFQKCFRGQLYWLCDKCIWSVFQNPDLSVLQRISNLIHFNEYCLQNLVQANDDALPTEKFVAQWNTRLIFLQNKYDFYHNNECRMFVKNPFGLDALQREEK